MYSLKDFGVTKEVGALDNGSKIILYRKPKMPLSTIAVFDAGSRHDFEGKDGLAHFTEHVLFKGTEKFKDETEVGFFLENIGGQTNAFTWVDCLAVSAEVGMSEDYPKVVDFIYELTRKSLFNKDKIEVERGIITEEISDYESNPQAYIYDLSQQNLFQGTDIGRSVAGNKETVGRITREDLYRFYSDKIVNGKMTVIVAGDIEMKKLLDLYNKTFGAGNLNVTYKPLSDLEIIRTKPVVIKSYKDTDQIYMSFGFRTCPYKCHDLDVLSVIGSIAVDGTSSSLFRKLRTENGLVYSIGVSNDALTDGGYFNVKTSTSKDKVQKVLDILVGEFKRFCDTGVTSDELILAKNKMIKSKVRQMQQSSSWVEFHFPADFFNPEGNEDLAGWLNRVESITLEDISRVSNKYLSSNKWYLSMCGDIKESDFKVNY